MTQHEILVDSEFLQILNIYRKIRHVVRQGYNFKLDWERLSLALANVYPNFNSFKEIIQEYLKT
ncbi:MAG: hypothetical protein QG635_1012 [Bacteroidota bacterium]|nr:hypothetical protein [Bacteroidota bacterium]